MTLPIAALFYRGQDIETIKKQSYSELRYWYELHKALVEAERPKDE